MRFGEYVVTKKLGEGGMAEVFLAEAADQSGEILEVAIKVMKPGAQVPGADAAELFANEADIMGLLRHPNLVQLYEVGSFEGRMFLAMEYVLGTDLEGFTRTLKEQNRPFPPSLATAITLDVLKALAYVHQLTSVRGVKLGLVHGDVNPANIFLSATHGVAKLGDFGVAQSAELGGLPEGMSAGKLHYLSPEQATGKQVVPGSDLFAIGIILFEMLMGERPFEGKTQEEVVSRISSGKYHRPGDLSGELAKLFDKAFAKNPKSRFQTAGQFAGEVLRYQLDSDLQLMPSEIREFFSEALGIVS